MKLAPEILQRYNAPGLIVADAPSDNDLLVAGAVAQELQKHYPGWSWGIDANVRQGLIDIRCLELNARHGYVIKVVGLYSWDSMRDAVKQAGGEILERYHMPRGKMDLDTWRDQPRLFTGMPKGEIG